jgi:hypothetical protein
MISEPKRYQEDAKQLLHSASDEAFDTDESPPRELAVFLRQLDPDMETTGQCRRD